MQLSIPPEFKGNVVAFLTEIEQLQVDPDLAAKIIIDERSGIIVMGRDVRVNTVAVAQGNLTVTISESPQVSQPNAFARGRTGLGERIAYLQSYTDALTAAIKDGADVRGYLVWSLIDNFEWNLGYEKRFGLAYVDYATQQRIPKASFAWYSAKVRKRVERSQGDSRRRG